MNEELIAFLDKYGLEGTYSGGGDSGDIDSFDTILANDDSIDIKALESTVYNATLGPHYGSWAWEGSAGGIISYNKETKTIVVQGFESSDGEIDVKVVEEIDLTSFFAKQDLARVDTVAIYFTEHEGQDDQGVIIRVMNGAWTPSLQKAEDDLHARLSELRQKHDGYLFYINEEYPVDAMVKIKFGELEEEAMYWKIDLLNTPLEIAQ